MSFQHSAEGDTFLQRQFTVHPIGGRYPRCAGAVIRKGLTNDIKDFERKAYAVFEGSAVSVRAPVGKRRQERVKKITMRDVDLHRVEANPSSLPCDRRKYVADAVQPVLVQCRGCDIVCAMRHVRRSFGLPTIRKMRRDLLAPPRWHVGRRLPASMGQLDCNRHVRPPSAPLRRAGHCRFGGVIIQPDIRMTDPAFGQNSGRLDGQQGGARLRQGAKVHQMPVIHAAVDR